MRDFLMSFPPVRRLHYRLMRLRRGRRGETDETKTLAELAAAEGAPKTFIEFGFHPVKFNCAAFAYDPSWQGLLIDGSAEQVGDARALLPKHVDIRHCFLSLTDLDFIRTRFPRVGVLSIDVDGNDYWFLERLIGIEPSVIAVEYNASLGPDAITVPYDAAFDRHQKHPSGWYHGASLAALAKLCARSGYGLAAVSCGANAFFTKSGGMDPADAWRPNRDRDQWSGTTPAQQWDSIKGLPYVAV